MANWSSMSCAVVPMDNPLVAPDLTGSTVYGPSVTSASGTHLHRDLEVGDLAIGDAVAHRLLDKVGGGADGIGHPVGVVGHGSLRWCGVAAHSPPFWRAVGRAGEA